MVLFSDIVRTVFLSNLQDDTSSELKEDFELSKIIPGKAARNHLELPNFVSTHQPETNITENSEPLDFFSIAAQYLSQSNNIFSNNYNDDNRKNRRNSLRSFFTQANEYDDDDVFFLNEIIPSRSHPCVSSNENESESIGSLFFGRRRSEMRVRTSGQFDFPANQFMQDNEFFEETGFKSRSEIFMLN
ncbi:9824_t:CDS:1 [Ambispora gerdemannii]|uniref:9824_t:CDS:1 n=1 Tax=Ambispora gerdemannii TaxID=144530 RepID=A0A9N9DE74_9GLOM|nr:9824_t:CDS:1 [Ambispora gerdemannii]